jgi:hypothetical protein
MANQQTAKNSGTTQYDFSKLTPEEQSQLSKKMADENKLHNDDPALNEAIAGEARKQLDEKRARHNH